MHTTAFSSYNNVILCMYSSMDEFSANLPTSAYVGMVGQSGGEALVS